MKNKKIIYIISTGLLIVMILVLNVFKTDKTLDDKINVVASFYPQYTILNDLTKNMSSIKISLITENVSGCIHDYALTPLDMKKVSNADLIFINGQGMDETIYDYAKTLEGKEIIDTSIGLYIISSEEETNSHMYLYVDNYIKMVQTVANSLENLNISDEEKLILKENKEKLIKALYELQINFNKIKEINSKNVVLSHDSFEYLFSYSNINVVEILEEEHESEINPKKIANIIDNNKKFIVDAIFISQDFDKTSIDNIVNETGCKVYALDDFTSDNSLTYIETMNNNINVIISALTK